MDADKYSDIGSVPRGEVLIGRHMADALAALVKYAFPEFPSEPVDIVSVSSSEKQIHKKVRIATGIAIFGQGGLERIFFTAIDRENNSFKFLWDKDGEFSDEKEVETPKSIVL